MSEYRQIPPVSTLPSTLGILDPAVRRYLDMLTNVMDQRSGASGKADKNRFITSAELAVISAKLASLTTLVGSGTGAEVDQTIASIDKAEAADALRKLLRRTTVVTSGSITMGAETATDYSYFVAGAHIMSLPAPNNNRYTVKNTTSANITVDTAGAELIEGAASISIAPESSVDILSNGTNWFVV